MTKIYTGLFMVLLVLGMQAQVKINEYSVSNGTLTTGQSTFQDNYSDTPDWVELYNSSATAANIGGWFFSDDPSAPGKYTFPAGTSVPPNGFLRVWCSGKGSGYNAPGHVHTTFKLTQCKGEWIVLSNGGTVVDSVKLRLTQLSHGWGRSPDGSATWKVYTTPTPGVTNTGTSYDGYAPTPVLSLQAGFYNSTQNLTMSVAGGNTIYYTTDGMPPTSFTTLYTSAVSITTTTAVRAIAYSNNPAYLPSFVETNTYFISETIDGHYGVVSVCGTYTTDLFPSQTKIGTTFEYFENNQFIVEGSGRSDKHGNDSWAYPQKGFDIEIKDDYGYTDALKYKFFVDPKMGASKRKEFQHIIMKAAASDNYPQNGNGGGGKRPCHMRDAFVQTYSFRKDLELDGRRNKHTILFINGAYWGVYELREAFDEDYTEYYYDQPKDSIDNLANWGGLQIRNGSDTGWTNLYNFMMANPMTVPANYAYVDKKLNLKSLIDYMVYNSYVVNSDFVNWNSAWWRGRAVKGDKKKWRYWNWDMDNVYDLGENFSGLPTTDMTADPCAYQNVFQNAGPTRGHPDMLEKLLANPGFKSMYINRYADLLNTAFKCDSIMDHFNYFKTILTPEMPRHIALWGGSMADWNQNMDTLESKIQQRCSYIESKIKSCYNVTGPFPVTVTVDPPGSGDVKLNTIWLSNFAWSGNYFGGVDLSFQAKPLDTALFEFDYWEFAAHTPTPGVNNDSVGISFSATEHVVAHFKPKGGDVFFPTGFTPNGDGINEVLFPLGTRSVSNIHVEIFNRWGQRVYLSDDPNKGWDGSFNGQQAQTGVYAYFITYKDAKGEDKIAKGNVTLIR